MPVLAHAADFVLVAPAVVIVVWIAIRALLDRRREVKDEEREKA
jgi:hypothetical protein